MKDTNKILNLLYPLLKRYYYNGFDSYPKNDTQIKSVEDLMWIITDEQYIQMEREAEEKAIEHIKKLFPEFEKIEIDG